VSWLRDKCGNVAGPTAKIPTRREMQGVPKEQMRVYKFKDLTDERKHSHFLQMVLKNWIWCAGPDSLNDEDEFRFAMDYEPSPHTHQLLSQVVAQYRTTSFLPPPLSASLALENDRLRVITSPIIDDIIEKCRSSVGVTSFSMTKADDRLWEEYGGKGNGACVEINIPDHLVGHDYHRVRYVPAKVFHIDTFLESAVFPHKVFQTFQNVLLTKTKKWEQEEEIRFIGNRQNVNLIFDGYISEVTFGSEVPAETLTQLTVHIADHCHAHNIKISQLP
jgi:hypothetical protein